MTDLAEMLETQRQLQIAAYGKDPCTLEGEERAEFIRWNVLALEDELHEALQEVGWKPWASSRHVNVEPFLKEMVDAWHFFMNLLLVVGQPTPDAVADFAGLWAAEYQAKARRNLERQQEGYDGVESKCRACHRDLREAGVGTSANGEQWCSGCGAVVVPSNVEDAGVAGYA